MNVTINALELASELAHEKLIDNWDGFTKIYNDGEESTYTEEMQDIFNEYYDTYLNLIESCKSN